MSGDNTYSTELERVVLSTIVMDPATIDEVSSRIGEGAFYLPAHAKIFDIVTAMNAEGYPVVEDTIVAKLGDDANALEALMQIVAATPIANVAPLAEQLADLQIKREMLRVSATIAASVHEEGLTGNETMGKAVEAIEQIGEIGSYDDISIEPINTVAHGETEFILEEWMPMPRGTVSMLAGHGGTGKTWMAIQAAERHAIANPSKRVVMWLSEDPAHVSRSRAEAVADGILFKNLSAIHNIDLIAAPPVRMIRNGQLNMSAFARLKRRLRGYDMIVLDPMLGFFGGRENDNADAWTFMQPFKDWAAEQNIVIMMLHHSRKGEDEGRGRVRGAGAFVDACRVVYEIDRVYSNPRLGELDENALPMRDVTLRKDNYGAVRLLDGFKVQRKAVPSTTAAKVQMEYRAEKVEMPTI